MKVRTAMLCVFVLFLSVFFCACTQPPKDKSDLIAVTVVDSPLFTSEGEDGGAQKVFRLRRNGSVTVLLRVAEGYYVAGTDYGNSVIGYTAEGLTAVTLNGVKYPLRLTVSCAPCDAVVFYDANGGAFADGATTACVPYDKRHHLRVNTLSGAEVAQRQGFALIGWNTAADGSGVHIGLGSRVSVEGRRTLYAEWARESAERLFETRACEGGVAIIGYCGEENRVVIPKELGGERVVEISSGAFFGCNASAVVLPSGLERVAVAAFRGCAFSELYLSDEIGEIYDGCFIGCDLFSTVHINAYEPPRYTDLDRHANFADKYDILIENRERDKLIVFSGSSAYFSVDTKRIEAQTEGFVCINMAVNAYFNAVVQFEIMEKFLKSGDIFIHAPEATGDYQLMRSVDMDDTRLFMSLESNYDLFALVDIRDITGEFDAFTAFNAEREDAPPKSYADYAAFIDERGNYAQERAPHGINESISGEADIDPTLFEDAAATSRINGHYKKIADSGVEVYLCNAPVNRQALMENNGQYQGYAAVFDNLYVGATYGRYPLLVALADCIYDGKDFYNSDYHLSDEATAIHTQKIIDGLNKYRVV